MLGTKIELNLRKVYCSLNGKYPGPISRVETWHVTEIVTEDGKCDTVIQRIMGIENDAFPKLSKVIKQEKYR